MGFRLLDFPLDGFSILRDGSAFILYDRELNVVGDYDSEYEARKAAKELGEKITFALI